MDTGRTRIARDDLPLTRPFAEPRGATAIALAEIWRMALNLDRVGADDDYNELGGDSVCAAVIFAAIEDRLGVILPISTLVDAPTIARLALTVERLRPV